MNPDILELSWDLKFMADNEWAENDMSENMTSVKAGNDKILWANDDEEVFLAMAD